MSMERTLIILKPDCVARGLMGEVISRIERKELSIIALKIMKVPLKLAKIHYAEHKGKDFLPGLLKFITSGPVVPMIVEGRDAVVVCRHLMGKTDCALAEPGTIRGDYGNSNRFNLIHGSDSTKSAKREIALWFDRKEIIKNTRCDTRFFE